MGKDSGIEWTHHTFNPWIGCSKVSPGCANCYAAVDSPARIARSQGVELWGPNGSRKIKAESGWDQPLVWDRAAKKAGERRKVFSASQSDVFEDRPELVEPRLRLFNLILGTPNLDWLLLTKRPENVEAALRGMPVLKRDNVWDHLWPHRFPNVWLGVSVEDQQRADERIPHLLRTPAAVRFLSVEPMLGPIDLTRVRHSVGRESYMIASAIEGDDGFGLNAPRNRIDWVIVGGESGPKARPMHPDWARSVRDQCVAAGVAFHFKQFGEWAPCNSTATDHYLDNNGKLYRSEHLWMDIDLRKWQPIKRVGKKAAGRLLDGRTWDEFPTRTEAKAS